MPLTRLCVCSDELPATTCDAACSRGIVVPWPRDPSGRVIPDADVFAGLTEPERDALRAARDRQRAA